MKRAALYVRVSTDEQKQNGLSVDSQIKALKDYCADNDLYEVKIYNDAGHSARKKYTTRPALMELLEDCKNDKFDIIIFTKLDRWFRSVADYYSCQAILDENHVPWKAIWEDYSTDTPENVFKVNIMLSVAQSESDNTRARVKSIIEYRKSIGKFVGGTIPYGYKLVDGDLVVDESAKDILDKFFDIFIASGNIQKCMRHLDECNHPMSRCASMHLLKSDYYRGCHNDYKCYAYLTPEKQRQIDTILENNKRTHTNNPKRTYYFSGIVRCAECGGRFGGGPINKSGKYHYKYKSYCCINHKAHRGCSCKRIIFESTIEKYMLKNIESILEDTRYKASLVPENASNNIELMRNKLMAKLKRIGIRFEDGDITLEEYREKKDAIKIELSKLTQEETPQSIPELPDNWKDIYAELDDEHRRAFWHRILKSIEISSDKSKDFLVRF